MKLRGWITLGMVLIYGLARSELIAHANETFLAQLAPQQLWEQWHTLLTSSPMSDEGMMLLASGAFLLGMLGVWWGPLMHVVHQAKKAHPTRKAA